MLIPEMNMILQLLTAISNNLLIWVMLTVAWTTVLLNN